MPSPVTEGVKHTDSGLLEVSDLTATGHVVLLNEIEVRNPVLSRPVSASILSDEEGRGAQELPRQEWFA